jgi:hypothetical protein
MQGGVLYCVIVGGVFLLAAVFSVGMIFWMYVTDRWNKKNDPGAPGFLELDRRGRTTTDDGNRREAETAENAEPQDKSE